MNAREAAELYISLGWYPIPLLPKSKECRDAKWREHIYVAEEFQPEDNVGIRLVKASDTRSTKLVSVDLDASEVVKVARAFLPESKAAWGRETKPLSQVLFIAPFEKPVVYKDFSAGGTTLVEIRVDHQSMAPPSTHPNGERLKWTTKDTLCAPVVDPKVLQRAVQLIATTAMVVRYYNPAGNRHDWGIALAGAMRQLGLTQEEAQKVIVTAAHAVGDTKQQDRKTEVKTTYALSDDNPIAGFGKLHDLVEKGDTFVLSLRRIWGGGIDFNLTDKGKVAANDQANVARALERMGISLSFNMFSNKMMVTSAGRIGPIDDDMVDTIWLEIDKRFGFRPNRDFFDRVLRVFARKNSYHPVIDYLDTLTWDGVPRIDRWLTTYGGAIDDPFTRSVASMFLIAAVRRVKQPGCKFDEIVILESPQGWNKSSALRALCPLDDWFSDDLPLNVDAKQVIERTAGKWIVEAAELSGMRKSQVEQLKATLSRQVDGPVRLAYGRISTELPRQFVVAGTTNATAYLKDQTGNRRFWPVRVQRFDIEGIKRDRDQLWAEAASREEASEAIRLDPSLYAQATHHQEQRAQEDPWEDLLSKTLYSTEPKQRVLPERLWDILGIPVPQRDERAMERIGSILQKQGFRRIAVRQGDRIVKGWGRDLVDGVWTPVPESGK